MGVNVKSTDDVPHDKISLNRPQALYVVPAQAWIKSQSHFKEVHRSEYKQRQGPDYVVPSKRPGFVRKPQKSNGGVQPKKHVCIPDETFVMGLIHSGIPLEELQFAFSKKSFTSFNRMLRRFWEVPEVAAKLSLLFGGKHICDNKFRRVKPIFQRLVKG